MSTDFASYDNDSWYVKNKGATGGQSDVTVGSPTKAHPYANVNISQPTDPTDPTDPNDPTPPEERDGYNYYPEFDDVEDIPSRLVADDIKLTTDDLGAAGFTAYKAGGGDAKVKEGLTVAQVIKQGQININAFNPGAPVQKPISNPKTQAPNLYKGLVQSLNELPDDMIPPGTQYRTNIAVSIIANKPVVSTPTSNDIRLFKKGLERSLFGNEHAPHPIVKTPVPYADENIRERPDGTVEINPDPSTNNTSRVANLGIIDRATLGYTNPIAAAGKAQMQLVVPNNNPNNAYLRFTDHAYANLKSPDKGEFPSLTDSPIARLISGDFMGVKPHTGGFKGYPPNIKGDQITRFDIPYGELPSEIKSAIDLEIDSRQYGINKQQLGSGTLGDTLQGTDATDAATVSADNKRKKKTNAVAEMYEPKAKHNDKVSKVTGKLKSVSDFFNQADVKPVYPKDPPPEMINGRHPDLVDDEKISNRFDKLDPISAKSMPKTGNPKIDAKVAKALKKPK
jgi:hypothetical protein